MARLTTGFASGVFRTEGFGFALETITGGRLTAVGAVFVEALFEFNDAGLELGGVGRERDGLGFELGFK